ncbi:MAG: YbaN family protein [Bacteroidota bacterium]
MKLNELSKPFLIAAGWTFVALGIIGIFLPLVPTTIFFILAAWCFAKSSEKFYNWLIYHPRFGKFVRNFHEKKGMPVKSKIIAVVMLILTIGSSAIFFTHQIIVRVILFCIALGVSAYIISLKTLREDVSSQ